MSSSSERSDHKKKHDHKKASTSFLPPDMVADGGFTTRIQGVPGSTPGCTAGAYARPLGEGELPEVNVKTCFPDHYTLGKKWFTEAHPKSLQMILTGFGPSPSIADMVNKWLIRRVSRKCAEGTEEGRKDMEAFCVDAVKRLRKIPTSTMVLYRACPWSAMGNSAPGLSELEEECDVVWPTFASLTKSEKRARQMFKNEGGILFVVNTDQARDVSDIAAVQNEGGEYMLEPNSCFTIKENKQEDKVFVVKMQQNYPSLRPILKEVADSHKHGHHNRTDSGSERKSTFEVAQPTMQPRSGDGATIITPVVRRAPSMPSSPLTRKSSLNWAADGNTINVPSSPLGFARSSSRVMAAPSPFGKRTPSRPTHRTQANMHSAGAMTMWSAACGYIKVYSCAARGKNHTVKSITPEWATEKKEKKEEDKEKKKKDKKDKKDKKKKDKEKEKEKDKDSGSASASASALPGDDFSSPPTSPSSVGPDAMVLCPTSAPTYIINESAEDWETLGGIILNMPRSSPRMVMSLRR